MLMMRGEEWKVTFGERWGIPSTAALYTSTTNYFYKYTHKGKYSNDHNKHTHYADANLYIKSKMA